MQDSEYDEEEPSCKVVVYISQRPVKLSQNATKNQIRLSSSLTEKKKTVAESIIFLFFVFITQWCSLLRRLCL